MLFSLFLHLNQWIMFALKFNREIVQHWAPVYEKGKLPLLLFLDTCWSRSDLRRSIPAPDRNHDTCKGLKAYPLSNMHERCGASLTSCCCTLHTLIYDRDKGHDCLQYVTHMMPLRKYVQGGGGSCAFTQTVAGQKPLLEYTALLFTTCIRSAQEWGQPFVSSATQT